jgi:hypothetical protein
MPPRTRSQAHQAVPKPPADPNPTASHSRGARLLKRHLRGQKLTLREAVYAKCCECMNWFEDGRRDCEVVRCPLHPWQPYKPRI